MNETRVQEIRKEAIGRVAAYYESVGRPIAAKYVGVSFGKTAIHFAELLIAAERDGEDAMELLKDFYNHCDCPDWNGSVRCDPCKRVDALLAAQEIGALQSALRSKPIKDCDEIVVAAEIWASRNAPPEGATK